MDSLRKFILFNINNWRIVEISNEFDDIVFHMHLTIENDLILSCFS